MARIHYDILQIQPGASAEEVQHAYRSLALRYHPDRNPAPDAAVRMAAINEAYEILRANAERRVPMPLPTKNDDPCVPDDFMFSIRSAARAVILRCGWTSKYDDGRVEVFETGKTPIRIVLTDRLTNESLLRIARRHRDLSAILAVRIEGPIPADSRVAVIDLMRAERHGAAIPDGPCKSLLSGFL